MTEFVKRAAFFDQVQVGQRIRVVNDDDRQPWTVTARRVEDVGGKPVICLLGISDEGGPRHAQGAGWVSTIIYEPVKDHAATHGIDLDEDGGS